MGTIASARKRLEPRTPSTLSRLVARPLLALLTLVVAGCGALERHPVREQAVPIQSVDLERPAGPGTWRQLVALKEAPAQCAAALNGSALRVQALPDRRNGSFCGYSNVVQILRSTVPYSGPVHLTCPMAAALYLWERDIAGPAAMRHLGSRLVRIDHMGTYSCRRIGGGTSGRPSEHAAANAIDISGFRLEDGRRVSVLRDWSSGGAAERAFLRDIRRGACEIFQVVLGPDYNAAHRDHFHFDLGRYRLCR
ncbi:MAG: extensin family protein [Alphaproteobacteria bacterium]|nr:extensin family protein [Alphaproteobacteria bacterium]